MIRYNETQGIDNNENIVAIDGLTELFGPKEVKKLKSMSWYQDGKNGKKVWAFLYCTRVTCFKINAAREVVKMNEKLKSNGGGIFLTKLSANVGDYLSEKLKKKVNGRDDYHDYYELCNNIDQLPYLRMIEEKKMKDLQGAL